LDDLLDLARLDLGQEVRIWDVSSVRGRRQPGEQQRRRTDNEHQHDDAVAEELWVQKEPPDRNRRQPRVANASEYTVGRCQDPLTEVMARYFRIRTVRVTGW